MKTNAHTRQAPSVLCSRCKENALDLETSGFCKQCRSAKARYSRKKGYLGEHEVERVWEEALGGKVRRTPRSGGFAKHLGDDWAGDFLFKDNALADLRLVGENKNGYEAFSKEWVKQGIREGGDRFFIRWKNPKFPFPIVILPEKLWLEIVKQLPRGETS